RSKPERRLIKRVTSTQLVQAERKCMNGMKVLPGAANDTMLDLTCLMTYTEKVVYVVPSACDPSVIPAGRAESPFFALFQLETVVPLSS
ncbi:hypothetical protein RRG08_065397, partial [Elysia crispata]